MAIIDHAEFSKVGIIQSSVSIKPAYFFSISPEVLETNTACILIPAGFPAIETRTPPSSLSKIIAALNPASCALLTLSSKLHPPLTINTSGELAPSPGTALLIRGEHASRGSAKYKVPHSPDPFIDGAKFASMSLNDNETFFLIKTTLAVAAPHKEERRRMYKTGKQMTCQSHLLPKHPNAMLLQIHSTHKINSLSCPAHFSTP